MSADCMRICAKCKRNAIQALEEMRKKASEIYGKVPKDEYTQLLAQISRQEQKIEKQWRRLEEYYTISVDENGVFRAKYSGVCRDCDFEFRFEYEEVALKTGEE